MPLQHIHLPNITQLCSYHNPLPGEFDSRLLHPQHTRLAGLVYEGARGKVPLP